MKIFSLILIYLGISKNVSAYHDGAGVGACQNRFPQHGYGFQVTKPPYRIDVIRRYIRRREVISVTINGTLPFKGYMLQAMHESSVTPQGKFHNCQIGVNMDCGLGTENTITHINSRYKYAVTLQWEADETEAEYVEFYATVLHNASLFWLDVKSPKVYIIENTSFGKLVPTSLHEILCNRQDMNGSMSFAQLNYTFRPIRYSIGSYRTYKKFTLRKTAIGPSFNDAM